MTDLRDDVSNYLQFAAEQFRALAAPTQFTREMERLAEQVGEPCVVAVVGRVKAGKSTLINALLGRDLAKVGVAETTATVNRFVYGTPDDAAKPIRCYWEGGRITHEPRQFLDQLQGNSTETLRRAEGIQCLEYLIPSELLREITLVDTPGTGSVVSDHTQRTDDFVLRQQLSARNTERTEQIRSDADAVIFLVGAAPRADDKQWLDEFAELPAVRAKARNVVGVMSKIDLYPGAMERRLELCQRIASQSEGALETVLPVSASLKRVLDVLANNDSNLLDQFAGAIGSVPEKQLEFLLEHEAFFLQEDSIKCPLTPNERRQWYERFAECLDGPLPWSTFVLIARTASEQRRAPEMLREVLAMLSGFQPLMNALRERFFHRGRILRCSRIVRDAQRALNQFRFEYLPSIDASSRERHSQLLKIQEFLRISRPPSDIRSDLDRIVKAEFDKSFQATRSRSVWGELNEKLGEISHRIEELNSSHRGLQMLDEHSELFTGVEQDELRALFGQFGLGIERRLRSRNPAPESARNGQLRWRRLASAARKKPRRLICNQAEEDYAKLLYSMRQTKAH